VKTFAMRNVPAGRGPLRPANWLYPASLAIVVMLIMTMLSSKGVVSFRYVQDLFVTFDAAWRAEVGHTPHLDFPSPIGQAYYWPYRVLASFEDVGASAVIQANALMAAVCSLLAAIALPHRLRPGVFAVAIIMVAAIALTPRDMDGGVLSFSYLAPYNTWAYGFALPAVLIGCVRPRQPASVLRRTVDGVALGLCFAALFYLKITFFAPVVLLVAFTAVVFRTLPGASAIAAAVAFAAMLGLVELLFHNNLAYLHDIQAALGVARDGAQGLRLRKAGRHLLEAAAFGAVLVAMLLASRPRENVVQTLVTYRRSLALAAAVVLIGAAIATQNHPLHQHALSVAGLLVGLEEALRLQTDRTPNAAPYVLTLAIAAIVPLLDGASIISHAVVSRSSLVCEMPGMNAYRSDLLVRRSLTAGGHCEHMDAVPIDVWAPPRNKDSATSKDDYYARYQLQQLEDGVSLLARERRAGDVIFASSFSNPYPFIFSTRPPAHSEMWWHLDRSFSRSRHPSSSALLSEVTLVLEVRDGVGADVWSVYGPDIRRDFRLVDETDRVRLWRRATSQPTDAVARKAPTVGPRSTSALGGPAIQRSGAG